MNTLESNSMADNASAAPDLRLRRVLFLSPTPAGSPILQAQGIPHLRELAARYGIHFVLLTMEDTDHNKAVQPGQEELRANLHSSGIDWITMRTGRMPFIPDSTSNVLRAIPRVARILRSHHIDLVHCRSYVSAFVMLALKPFSSIPWIFDVRGFYPDELVREGKWSAKSASYRISLWLERRSFDSAGTSVVVTHRQYEKLLQRWPKAESRRIAVIRNCADTAKFAPNAELRQTIRQRLAVGSEPLLVWSVGHIRSVHAPCEVLSFAKLCRNMFGSRLLILTQAPDADTLVQEAGLSPGEYMVVHARSEEVPAYLSAGDAGIAFIERGHEDLGIKFAEYIASGLPVVTNVPGTEWDSFLRKWNCGVVVAEFSSSALETAARELLPLLAGGDVTARCRGAALSEYSLESAVDAYARLYQRLLGECH